MNKLVLIDGQSLIYRMFYMISEDKKAENAVFAFFYYLVERIRENQPTHVAVLFEEETLGLPANLVQQLGKCRDLLETAGVFLVSGKHVQGLAESILTEFEAVGESVLITADETLLQNVSEKVTAELFSMQSENGHVEKYDKDIIKERYGVLPSQLLDVFSLTGERIHARKGVSGIGRKTACELIAAYETLENLYEQIQTVDRQWKKDALEAGKEQAFSNKAFFKPEKEAVVSDEAVYLFEESTRQNLEKVSEQSDTNQTASKAPKKKTISEYQTITVKTAADMKRLFEEAQKAGKCAVRLQHFPVKDMGSMENGQMFLTFGEAKELFCVFLCFDEKHLYVMEASEELTQEHIEKALQELLQKKNITVSCFAEKENYARLFAQDDAASMSAEELTAGLFDCNIAAYLLNPLVSEYKVAMLAEEYLDLQMCDWASVFGKTDEKTAYEEDRQAWVAYFAKETIVLLLLQDVLEKKLQETGMMRLFREMEMPLSYVLYDMEKEGILVKPDELKIYGEALAERLTELEQLIYEQAGETFNINSPKQLGEILFEKMQIPGGKKTKTGYSTAADVLEKLAPEYPFVKHILEYRGLAKLKSTYADGLAAFIGEDRRIHTHFNQTITATGRLSSTEPNLQNIPMRMELGRRIRKVFVPKAGCVFVDADYSQIELRVLAHMSQDSQLIEAYQMDEDIHRITASKVFHTPLEEVTDLQRRNAKAVNFGIVYGISSFGLSQDLSISNKEAKAYIDEYFKTYPGIKTFLDKMVEETKEKGWCSSMFGRRRPVPELKSSNHMQKAFGERIAMNSPIQGTAADLIKMAMVHVYDALKKAGLQSKLILQIHDELLIEAREEEAEKVREILTTEMKNVCDMAVSLETDVHTGSDWYEAK